MGIEPRQSISLHINQPLQSPRQLVPNPDSITTSTSQQQPSTVAPATSLSVMPPLFTSLSSPLSTFAPLHSHFAPAVSGLSVSLSSASLVAGPGAPRDIVTGLSHAKQTYNPIGCLAKSTGFVASAAYSSSRAAPGREDNSSKNALNQDPVCQTR
ncbi:unnamed protein product [Protopolystoma xenopodis]|uniref:Uncharacterized protein n=1 Tax=Protopolystoma xenopodis TaxID=117903 RepID=A0A3S4ZNZ4_9PLAT|nr:unnamed protein product [Protopolystoma xenopodis]